MVGHDWGWMGMGEGERESRLEPHIGVKIALFKVSRGYCYWPNCPHPVQKLVEGEPVVDVQIAHIHAERPDGARWNPKLSVEQRRSFANLLLLCKPHHMIVDRKSNEDRFPAPLLRAWKRDREGELAQALASIPDVTDEGLPVLVHQARAVAAQALDTAITEMQSTRADIAELLRSLRDAVFDLPRDGLNLDAVEMLAEASTSLGHLPYTSEELLQAANRLQDFPQAVDRLRVALEEAPALGTWADVIEERVGNAVAIAGNRFQADVEETVKNQLLLLPTPPANPPGSAKPSTADTTHRTTSAKAAPPSPTRARDRWRFFQWGAALGAVGLLAALLGAHWFVNYLHL